MIDAQTLNDLTPQQEIELLRAKQRDGTLTLEDSRRAIEILRADRKSAQSSTGSKGSSRKVAAPVIDVDDLI